MFRLPLQCNCRFHCNLLHQASLMQSTHRFCKFSSFNKISVSIFSLSYMFCDRGFESQHGQEIYLFSKHPDWCQGPPSLLFSGYRGVFPGVGGQGMRLRLTTYLLVVLKLMSGDTPPLPLYIFMACVGTTLLIHTYFMHLIIHDLITVIICGEKYKL